MRFTTRSATRRAWCKIRSFLPAAVMLVIAFLDLWTLTTYYEVLVAGNATFLFWHFDERTAPVLSSLFQGLLLILAGLTGVVYSHLQERNRARRRHLEELRELARLLLCEAASRASSSWSLTEQEDRRASCPARPEVKWALEMCRILSEVVEADARLSVLYYDLDNHLPGFTESVDELCRLLDELGIIYIDIVNRVDKRLRDLGALYTLINLIDQLRPSDLKTHVERAIDASARNLTDYNTLKPLIPRLAEEVLGDKELLEKARRAKQLIRHIHGQLQHLIVTQTLKGECNLTG